MGGFLIVLALMTAVLSSHNEHCTKQSIFAKHSIFALLFLHTTECNMARKCGAIFASNLFGTENADPNRAYFASANRASPMRTRNGR